MIGLETLANTIQTRFGAVIQNSVIAVEELTIEISPQDLHPVCFALRDEKEFQFEVLIDLCGVDYLHYGIAEWATEKATSTGFERGVEANSNANAVKWNKPRFAVVYHLLSLKHNQRLRLKVFLSEESLAIDSVITIWASANWYEREAFDLFGIVFNGHPDLRRILTDYGFTGHPFRKDFPLIGNVEVRYDAAQGRVIYEPVSIPPRTLVPKVIRRNTRVEISPTPPPSKPHA